MRVVFLSPGVYAEGGAERCLVSLLDGLRPIGVDTRVVTFGQGTLNRALEARGIVNRSLDLTGGFRGGGRSKVGFGWLAAVASAVPPMVATSVALQRVLREWRPDVVHSNG